MPKNRSTSASVLVVRAAPLATSRTHSVTASTEARLSSRIMISTAAWSGTTLGVSPAAS